MHQNLEMETSEEQIQAPVEIKHLYRPRPADLLAKVRPQPISAENATKWDAHTTGLKILDNDNADLEAKSPPVANTSATFPRPKPSDATSKLAKHIERPKPTDLKNLIKKWWRSDT